jgi:TDG/mug DNA glycosylase family protein
VLPGAGEPLRVLFCGINPSLYSAATGWHFARPGNRFWPALHLSGFTSRRLAPAEQDLLGGYGLGITNLVARATAQAAELDPAAPPSAVPAPPSARSPTPWAAPGSGSSPTPAA